MVEYGHLMQLHHAVHAENVCFQYKPEVDRRTLDVWIEAGSCLLAETYISAGCRSEIWPETDIPGQPVNGNNAA